MDDHDKAALAKCHDLQLHPLCRPRGDNHHTDAAFADEDERIGDAIAYFLGGLFVDVECEDSRYWYNEMTSVDVWRRVARALRIHGLAIADRTTPDPSKNT